MKILSLMRRNSFLQIFNNVCMMNCIASNKPIGRI